ncbi:hypothetical protein [Loigolactobacillus binensis]|uniref:Uncharacterized protein n=1 Tax=Loigolactobacillus binensis TaxID=2559922 RepID=A0ABW3EBQ8_9LACO|nr:hypothetical protein [Loigolactobacillus binensis]
MLTGVNQPLTKQVALLAHILRLNPALYELITTVAQLNLPNLYVGGGSITQSV